ncbi:peptidylprolyl isomerase [Kamptonema cortianum]|nr:peptidylprolyl isomerase [Geitlerinema splendidum]MDK3155857.1 peptidylprolyl isomerase [Kamptonema cortianum]
MITALTLVASVAVAPIQQQPALIKVSFDQKSIQPKDGDEVAIIKTSAGQMVAMFFDSVAPLHVANFKGLATKGFYDGIRFHRCIPGFMIQGGDPNSKNLNAPDTWGYGSATDSNGNRTSVDAEFSELKHLRGVLSMARSSDPNSASSQFFIMHADYPTLDGKYSAFGKVIQGLEVIDEIVKTGPTDRELNGKVPANKAIVIESIKLAKWPLTN